MGAKNGIRAYTRVERRVERSLSTLYLYYIDYGIGPDNLAMQINSCNCHKDSKCLENNWFC